MRADSRRSAGRREKAKARSDTPPWATPFAAEVRRRRKELRLTQVELAALARCGPDFLYDLENAKPTLRLDKLVTVLEVLGLRLLLEPGSGGVVVAVHGTMSATVPAPTVSAEGHVRTPR